MKTIPSALQTVLSAESANLCTLWKIIRTDGFIYRFTDHDQDLTYATEVYKTMGGYTPTNIKSASDMSVDNLEVQGFLDAVGLTEADVSAGLLDYAHVTITQINWASPSDGGVIFRDGKLGQVDLQSLLFKAEIRGLTQNLQQRIGETYNFTCRAEFGSQAPVPLIKRCGFNLATVTVTGTVTAVPDTLHFTDTGRTETVGFFALGVVTFNSGANNGLKKEIKRFLGTGQFELTEQMPYPIAIGDTYSVYPGCDKRPKTCRDTYMWFVNFKGEPYITGNDAIMKVGKPGGASNVNIFG